MISKKEQNIINSKGMKVWRLSQKLRLAKIISNRLNMNENEKSELIDIIKDIKDLQFLNRRSSNEKIISGICFFIMKKNNPLLEFEDFNVLRDYGLTLESFETILSRVVNYYQNRYIFYLYTNILDDYKSSFDRLYLKRLYKEFNTDLIMMLNKNFNEKELVDWIKSEIEDFVCDNFDDIIFEKSLYYYAYKINSQFCRSQIIFYLNYNLKRVDYVSVMGFLFDFFKGQKILKSTK